jgi:excinuclease ABC subunit A
MSRWDNGRPASPDKKGEGRFEPIRTIRVRGAREHNLKNVHVDLPRDRMVVITGLSGSGKSSLAFDTLFAEGQRKYMESLSAYARQFLDQLKKPDVDDIEGLPPTIAIEQRSAVRSPRSTVATSTEIYDYLRLLFARIGGPICWEPTAEDKNGNVTERCGQPIAATPPSLISAGLETLPTGTKVMVLAPVVRAKKGFHKEILDVLSKQGFVRMRVNGKMVDVGEVAADASENPFKIERYAKHTIEVVIDRLTMREGVRMRLNDSVETALKTAEGVVTIAVDRGDGTWAETTYSEHYSCPIHPHRALEELEPRLFSFNSPQGACQTCHGLGVLMEFDEELVIPEADKSFASGAIAPWSKAGPAGMFSGRLIRRFCKKFGFTPSTKISDLPERTRRVLLHGTTPEDAKSFGAHWDGVLPQLTGWFARTESESVKEYLQAFMSERECGTCRGDRLSIAALSVFVETSEPVPNEVIERRRRHGLTTDSHRVNLADISRINVEEARTVLGHLRASPERGRIAEPIIREVQARLGFLASVGLEYLSLDRKTSTLSGGEAQRIRLATQVGSGIVGAAYVLDEPTIGLHPRDNTRLIKTLRHLADIGNTVLVVEHDEEMIRSADHVLDIGPGPGVHGGEVVGQGSVDDVIASPRSVTGDYLSGRKKVDVPTRRRTVNEKRAIVVKGARENNLKKVDVAFPLHGILCVTGVSGSGKSTLVNDILLKAARQKLHGSRDKPGAHGRVSGLERVDRIVEVDQSPIGRTPRSNPATYTGVFDEIRKVFAQAPDARVRGYGPGRFSFNVKGGRCEACQGQGEKRISMHFLPDVYVTCEVCNGTRFNRETLDVVYRGKTIADVLSMTVDAAAEFFQNHPRIHRIVSCLNDVGLSYVELGQASTTLSRGEAQRVKLATELWKGDSTRGQKEHVLYVLDEPTTGLHFEDVRRLIRVLERLADQGHTLVVIEHNLDVVKCADWLIDLGPEGGEAGGEVVVVGTPETVAKHPTSHTARYLAPLLRSETPARARSAGRAPRAAPQP